MAHLVDALATKYGRLSSNPVIHMLEGEDLLSRMILWLPYTHARKINKQVKALGVGSRCECQPVHDWPFSLLIAK